MDAIPPGWTQEGPAAGPMEVGPSGRVTEARESGVGKDQFGDEVKLVGQS